MYHGTELGWNVEYGGRTIIKAVFDLGLSPPNIYPSNCLSFYNIMS